MPIPRTRSGDGSPRIYHHTSAVASQARQSDGYPDTVDHTTTCNSPTHAVATHAAATHAAAAVHDQPSHRAADPRAAQHELRIQVNHGSAPETSAAAVTSAAAAEAAAVQGTGGRGQVTVQGTGELGASESGSPRGGAVQPRARAHAVVTRAAAPRDRRAAGQQKAAGGGQERQQARAPKRLNFDRDSDEAAEPIEQAVDEDTPRAPRVPEPRRKGVPFCLSLYLVYAGYRLAVALFFIAAPLSTASDLLICLAPIVWSVL